MVKVLDKHRRVLSVLKPVSGSRFYVEWGGWVWSMTKDEIADKVSEATFEQLQIQLKNINDSNPQKSANLI